MDSFVSDSIFRIQSKMSHFACIECNANLGEVDHRWCLVRLFKTNAIKSVKEWEEKSQYNGYLRAREKPDYKAAACIQSVWRMFVARRRYRMRNVTIRKGRIRARIPRGFT